MGQWAFMEQPNNPVLGIFWMFVTGLCFVAVTAVVMLRFGVLATVTTFSLGFLGIVYPITGFSGAWWAGGKMTLLATIVVVAAYGAWCCARRPVPERE